MCTSVLGVHMCKCLSVYYVYKCICTLSIEKRFYEKNKIIGIFHQYGGARLKFEPFYQESIYLWKHKLLLTL